MAILGIPTLTRFLFPIRIFHLFEFKNGQEPDFCFIYQNMFEAEKGRPVGAIRLYRRWRRLGANGEYGKGLG